MAKKPNRISLLETALKAAENVIGWYEFDSDRSCHDDEEIPEDLRELEEALKAAKEKLKSGPNSLTAERRKKVR